MSTATLVPETWELTGDDARRTLRGWGRRKLLRDAFARLRVADGFSHARSLAYAASLVLAGTTMTLLFRYSPRRHQPALSWLAFGAAISTLLWAVVTLALAAFFSLSTSFGKTYGPLAGMIALLLWTFLAAVAVLYGAAVAAQLEAVRAGEHEPQDEQKVADSEPDAPRGRDDRPRARQHADSLAD
jgi:uncharacterized BrkB/YihY/UPF0761 family membrane protein